MARCIVLGIALWGAASLLVERLEPGPGELAAVRWLRVVAEHPVRGSLGLALLLGATLRGRSSRRASSGRQAAAGQSDSVSEKPEAES
jgi:hypothetical protein